ncbi:hypothetical protein GBZ48_00160 [Azospirillum melinis]|uniref:Uncharacterized protein n=1 Tax=Azospirillum melinis TaxID=328839 RepID=A0ABX2K8M6_9PROT|nr:hypothetical protein [Azospirillum melinis]
MPRPGSPDTVEGSRMEGLCEADYASASFCRLDGHQLSVVRRRPSGRFSRSRHSPPTWCAPERPMRAAS